MTQCDNCTYADWKRTSNGRLHPDKSGRCRFLEKRPLDLRLPAAFHWMWANAPRPNGGYITRGTPVKEKCIFKSGQEPGE